MANLIRTPSLLQEEKGTLKEVFMPLCNKIMICLLLICVFSPYGRASVPLPNSPDWQSGSSENTQSIALGDMNNDGFLDLAVATVSGPALVYKNANGTLQSTPFWHSTGSLAALSITWVDIDRDGDMDLAVGHIVSTSVPGPIKLYKNYCRESGGVNLLDTIPMWTSAQSEFRFWLGFADINGDNNVDLVATSMGTAMGGRNEVYYGTGTTLPTSPSWEDSTSSAYEHYNINGSLGDANGDGRLDLAVANSANDYAATAYIYMNNGSGLEYRPSWSTDDYNSGFSAVMARIDKDNRLDLLVGGSLATGYWWVHLDSAGLLQKGNSQSISASADWPWNGSFGDVDTNGYLDFAGANADQGVLGVQVLTNNNGVLTQEWSQTFSGEVYVAAWGDINKDGVVSAIDTLTGDGLKRLFYLKHYPAQSVDSVKAFFTYPAYEMLIYDPTNGWLWWTASTPIPNGTKVYVYYQYSKRLDLVVGVMNAPLLVYLNTFPPVPIEETETQKCQAPKLTIRPCVTSKSVTAVCYLPNSCLVKLDVYNIAGEKVKELVNGQHNGGANAIIWDLTDGLGRSVPSGAYFIHGMIDGTECSAKMTVIK
jgi:hypothetical protein